MQRAALALTTSLLLLLPTMVSAQSVLLVVDVGSAQLDVDSLRARIAAGADRTLVRLGDEASRATDETLTVAFAGEGRWVFRYQHGTRDTWAERTGVTPEGAAQAVVEVACSLIRPPEGAVHADEDYGTRAGADLVDPFDGRWDPLRVAIEGELVRPFIARGGVVYVGVADPFSRDAMAVHLLDPWTR